MRYHSDFNPKGNLDMHLNIGMQFLEYLSTSSIICLLVLGPGSVRQ